MRRLFTILKIFIFFNFCTFTSYGQVEINNNVVKIIQNKYVKIFNNAVDSIHLNRDSFSIRFAGKKYDEKKKKYFATQIAAVTEDSCLKYMVVGTKLADIPFYSPGTGLAAENFGYNNLFIDNEAHHYITYTNEKDRRSKLINKSGDTLELEWSIPQAFYNGEDISFIKLPFSHFYLIILNDANQNDIIDVGEFKLISVTFN